MRSSVRVRALLKPRDCRCATKQAACQLCLVPVVCYPLATLSLSPLGPPPFRLPRLPSCIAKSAAAEYTRSRHTGSNCKDNLLRDASPVEHRSELCTAGVPYNASEFSVLLLLSIFQLHPSLTLLHPPLSFTFLTQVAFTPSGCFFPYSPVPVLVVMLSGESVGLIFFSSCGSLFPPSQVAFFLSQNFPSHPTPTLVLCSSGSFSA